MIVDHDADLRLRTFSQVSGVLTATGGLPLVFLASTTGMPERPQSDTRRTQLAGRRTRAPAAPSRCQVQLANGGSMLWPHQAWRDYSGVARVPSRQRC